MLLLEYGPPLPFTFTSLSKRSGTDHTVLPAITPMPAFTSYKRSPDGASPDWGCRHLIAAYLSFIYTPKGWKAESAWLADLQRTVYPHKRSPVSCRSSVGQGKFAGQRPTFYHCATQPTTCSSRMARLTQWTSRQARVSHKNKPWINLANDCCYRATSCKAQS